MTDQTSETTPDGLDVAAVRERVEDYRRAYEEALHGRPNCLPDIAHSIVREVPSLLAALDEARGELAREIARADNNGYRALAMEREKQRLSERAAADVLAAESARDAAEGVVREVRALHRPIPIYPGDCESPDDDHGFDPAEEFCRDCPVEFEACGECREEDGSWIEWPCETALAVDPNRWVDDLVRAAALAAADATEGEA